MTADKVKKKKKMKTKDKVMLIISIIMIIVAGLALAAVVLMNTGLFSEGDLNASMATKPEISHLTKNFLVCGYDTDNEKKNLSYRRNHMADVIMVVNYDISAKKVNILQIPRDTYIDDKYPTGKTNKINAVTNQSEKKGGGIEGLATVINETFDIPIDYYVTITMDSFRGIVDVLGGIEIDSPTAFTSNEGYKIKKGKQLMSGQIAEAFVRERKNNGGDFGRQRSQRIFLSALMDRLLDASTGELTKMMPTLLGKVTTNLTLAEMLDLAKQAQGPEKSNIVFHSAPGSSGSYKVASGQKLSIYSLNKALMADLLNQYFRPYSDDVPAEELGIIQVFDKVTVEDTQEAMDNIGASSTTSKSSE